MTTWQKIFQLIRTYKEIILLIHENPDGDCLGSALALGNHLLSKGFQPILYHPETIPVNYDFLPGQEIIKVYREKELPPGMPVISLDCADLGRIGYSLPLDVPLINIDHHSSNSFFGDLNIVDPEAAATGELIFDLISEAQSDMSAEAATCLYVAISTDTGSFRYSNTTAKTLQIASELLSLGAKIDVIRENLFERQSLLELMILKLSLLKMQFSLERKIVWSVLSYQDLSAQNLLCTDTESVISVLRSIEGVETAILFKELEPGKVKISFRSKKYLNVNLLANEFGGGGHVRAAGCLIEGNLNEIVDKVLERAGSCLRASEVKGGDSYGRST